jgi:hypothetical protein
MFGRSAEERRKSRQNLTFIPLIMFFGLYRVIRKTPEFAKSKGRAKRSGAVRENKINL